VIRVERSTAINSAEMDMLRKFVNNAISPSLFTNIKRNIAVINVGGKAGV
jgi:hypothetical protein